GRVRVAALGGGLLRRPQPGLRTTSPLPCQPCRVGRGGECGSCAGLRPVRRRRRSVSAALYNAEISAGSLMLPESRRVARFMLAQPDRATWFDTLRTENILQKK